MDFLNPRFANPERECGSDDSNWDYLIILKCKSSSTLNDALIRPSMLAWITSFP